MLSIHMIHYAIIFKHVSKKCFSSFSSIPDTDASGAYVVFPALYASITGMPDTIFFCFKYAYKSKHWSTSTLNIYMMFAGRTSDTLSKNFFIFLQGPHHSAPNLNINTPGFVFNNSINTSRPPVYSTIRVVSTVAATDATDATDADATEVEFVLGFISFLL